jgi:hypothetical protein
MKSLRNLSAPVAIAVIGVFTIGASTSAAASHLITGKDIKNHSIGVVDLSHAAVKQLHGATGKPGAPGLPGVQWYGGHATTLNETAGTNEFYSAIGYSPGESSSENFVDVVGPPRATTMTGLTVALQNAPGSGSERDFELIVNGSPSPQCVVTADATSCNETTAFTIPANATIYFQSDVVNGDAQGADAAFGWTTKG